MNVEPSDNLHHEPQGEKQTCPRLPHLSETRSLVAIAAIENEHTGLVFPLGEFGIESQHNPILAVGSIQKHVPRSWGRGGVIQRWKIGRVMLEPYI